MKVIDYIREQRDVLEAMKVNDITPNDVVYLPIIDAYDELLERGFKTTFAVEYLSQKHYVSVANLYRALRKFRKEVV